MFKNKTQSNTDTIEYNNWCIIHRIYTVKWLSLGLLKWCVADQSGLEFVFMRDNSIFLEKKQFLF